MARQRLWGPLRASCQDRAKLWSEAAPVCAFPGSHREMWRLTSANTLDLLRARKSRLKVSLFFLLLLRRHLPSQLSVPILMNSSGAKNEYELFHWASFAFVLVTQDTRLLREIGSQLNPSIKNLGCPNLFHSSFLGNQSPVSSAQLSYSVASDSAIP